MESTGATVIGVPPSQVQLERAGGAAAVRTGGVRPAAGGGGSAALSTRRVGAGWACGTVPVTSLPAGRAAYGLANGLSLKQVVSELQPATPRAREANKPIRNGQRDRNSTGARMVSLTRTATNSRRV